LIYIYFFFKSDNSSVIKESKLMLTSCSGQCLKCHHNYFVKNTD